MLEMSFLDSLGISLLGFIICIVALAVLACIIVLISKAVQKASGSEKQTATGELPVPPKPAASAPRAIPDGSVLVGGGDTVLRNVSDRDAAMIMAIVADTVSIPVEQLKFKSIKLIEA